jgi:hypothetical protein
MPPRTDGFEGAHFQQTQTVGLLECTRQLPFVSDFGEVEKRAGDRRYRNSVLDGSILFRDPPFVNDKSKPPSTACRGDFDGCARWLGQAPKRTGASVAEHCALSARQNRCHPLPLQAHFVVAKRKYASVHSVQSASCDPALDRPVAQPQSE